MCSLRYTVHVTCTSDPDSKDILVIVARIITTSHVNGPYQNNIHYRAGLFPHSSFLGVAAGNEGCLALMHQYHFGMDYRLLH
eukprot:scaffold143034_cov20-Prasinocladus_malaysianus.AAC.1